jgi:hypothetical protein
MAGKVIAHYNPSSLRAGYCVLRSRFFAIFDAKKPMAKTSIHVSPVLPSSEEHNQRLKPLDYVKKELSQDNSSLVKASIPDTLKEIKANYRATVKQKMQKDATPIREAVVVIDKNTKMKDLEKLSENLEKRFGLKTFQIHIHQDEGHTNKEGEFIHNRHAHMVIDWTEGKTGKTIKMSKEDMAEMQTITAESLGMERGVSSEKKHLNAIQFKAEAKKEEFREVEKERKEAKFDLEKTKLLNTSAKTGEKAKKVIFDVINRIGGNDETKDSLTEAEKEIERIKKELEKTQKLSNDFEQKVISQGKDINGLKSSNEELSKSNMRLENQIKHSKEPQIKQPKQSHS